MKPISQIRTVCRSLAAALALCITLTGCMASVETVERSDSKPDAEEPFSIASLTPGEDFYGWCNASQLMEMHIPENSSSVGSFSDAQTAVDHRIKDLIYAIATRENVYPRGSNEQLIHDLYHLAYDSCTGAADTTAYDEALAQKVFDAIDAANSIPALCSLWEMLGRDYGCCPVLLPGIVPDLYDPTRTALYVRQTYGLGGLEEAVEEDYRASYLRDDLRELLYASGIARSESRERATQLTYLLLDIGSVTEFYSDDNLRSLDECWFPHTQEQLAARLTHITPDTLCRMLGVPDYDGEIVFENDAQLFMIDSLLDEPHLQAWKDLTRCCFVQEYSLSLPVSCGGMPYDETNLPERFAVDAVQYALEREVGEVYAAHDLTGEQCEDILRMCEEIKDEYRVLISGSGQLSDAGKQALCSKLDNMPCFVGADVPHETDARDAGTIGRSLLETEIRLNARTLRQQLDKLGEPAERSGFSMMPPQTVNACYDPQLNCFNITAAILQPPFYDPDADPAVNLGGIGAIIGHEISHAFDDNGMKYDADGCFRPDWIPQSDRGAFKALQERTAAYYSTFRILDTYAVKGRLTLGENLADISGVQCVLAIAGTPEKQKLVFESYANLWKELSLDSDAKNQLSLDSHSPGPVRVNAVVACFDEFYDIYGVQEGDALYVAPADRIRRW